MRKSRAVGPWTTVVTAVVREKKRTNPKAIVVVWQEIISATGKRRDREEGRKDSTRRR